MNRGDLDYYRARAAAEERAAERAAHPAAAESHRHMARAYASMLAEAEREVPHLPAARGAVFG